ncbi:MAG: DNA-processing protein DprA [Desulfitobacterium sp.]
MKEYWLWLSMLKGVGPVTLRKLIDTFGTPLEVYKASYLDLTSVPGIRRTVADTIIDSRSLDAAKHLKEKMFNLGIKLCAYREADYPSRLNIDSRLPAVLYYRGQLQIPVQSIGIIGSRRCTSYGKQVTAEVAEYLGQQGVTVVSGLAKGIDSYAHTACLKAGGYTLAFVANGPEICYPPEHQGLMNEIINNGAIISPFPPGTRPKQEYFPLRNQLLSAWVDKLLVVEAAERSGALITAKYAMEYGRPVYAVPNSIYAVESKGTNRLLQNGAIAYLTPEELASLKLSNREARELKPHANHSEGEKWVMEHLDKPMRIEDLQATYPGDTKDLLAILVQLEILGEIIITGQLIKRG